MGTVFFICKPCFRVEYSCRRFFASTASVPLLVSSFGFSALHHVTAASRQRTLAAISNGVLQTVVHQSLPEVDPAAFLDLVDDGEGNEEAGGVLKLSYTPLRMCRYAGGADGVAFGECSQCI